MTTWEAEFIDSLDKQRNGVGGDWAWEPSFKQEDTLEQIWTRVFG